MTLRINRPLLAGLVAFALLYAAAAIRYEGFFSTRVALNLLGNSAMLGVVAIGVTFVILSGGIDLSVGAVMGASSVLIAVLIMRLDWPPAAAVLLTLACGALLGAALGGIIHATGIPAFIVTLAGMFLVRGCGYLLQLESIAIHHPQYLALSSFALRFGDTGRLSLPAIVLLGCVLVAAYVLRTTPFGRSVYALGGEPDASRLLGLPVARTRVSVYAISGLCAAISGFLLTVFLSSGSHIEGVGLELDAIAAVVVGGTLLTGGVGSVFGTLLGVLIIGIVVEVIMTYEGGFSSGFSRVAIGGLLLVFVLIQRMMSGTRT